MFLKNISLVDAAKQLLAEQPGWFWQTPEGEYLEEVIRHDNRNDRGIVSRG
jgi:hypothetical protein